MKFKVFAVFAAILVLASGCARSADQTFTIEIGGSTSVVPVLELLVNEYQSVNPHVRINVHSTGSSDGIRNAGVLYQFGMTSRELAPTELGMGLNEQLIAIDGIAVIVHASSPVINLTIEQIRSIYTGDITDWSQVSTDKSGAIAVVTREEGSGTRGAFEEIVGFPGLLRAGAVEGPSTGAVRSNVAGNPNAIGYISVGSVDGSVRAITINDVAPTTENMLAGTYSIARPFIMLYRDLHPASRAFLDWAIIDGQVFVARSWVPIN
ncbi:MAG: phosphate ABC transporter substrate-binding protein [Treponema sp.]|nr:phosphate ABC transporter substrate-binding protein [Treponema sp.]